MATFATFGMQDAGNCKNKKSKKKNQGEKNCAAQILSAEFFLEKLVG